MPNGAGWRRGWLLFILALVCVSIAGHFLADLGPTGSRPAELVSAGTSQADAGRAAPCAGLLHQGVFLAPLAAAPLIPTASTRQPKARPLTRLWAPCAPFHPPILA